MGTVVFTGYKGFLMTTASTEKSIKKKFKEADTQTKKAKMGCAAAMGLWGMYLAYKLHAGGPGAEELREAIESLKLTTPSDPVSIALAVVMMTAKFAMGKLISRVAFTDLLIVSIFDAADDELEAKTTGKMDDTKEKMLKDWHTLLPPKKKRKKKKKKKDKERSEKKKKK